MLGAANNPDSGKIDVQVALLPPEQRDKILRNAKQMITLRRNVTRRAREELLAMSDAEWERLVEEAIAQDE